MLLQPGVIWTASYSLLKDMCFLFCDTIAYSAGMCKGNGRIFYMDFTKSDQSMRAAEPEKTVASFTAFLYTGRRQKGAHMKEDSFLLGQIEDRIAQCENKYITTYTGFLDSHQQSLARLYCRKNHVPVFDRAAEQAAAAEGRLPSCRTRFYGGYDDAERVILINLPDYAFLEDDDPLTVIRASVSAGGKSLAHRDYLGSLTGLGIKRDLLGDILVRPDGADIIVLADIAEFLLMTWCKAGRAGLSLEQVPVRELIVPEIQRKTITDTVASLRLDNMVAAAFGLSRVKAAEAVKSGIVFLNHVETVKADAPVGEGDQITLRGKGKARVAGIGGRSRKDRIYVEIERY